MRWFKRRDAKALKMRELEEAKRDRKKVVNQALVASRNVVKVIENNGFTVKIYIAAGGQTKKGKSHAH